MIPLAKDFYWHSSVKLWRKVDSILVNISLDEETYKKIKCTYGAATRINLPNP
jgi:hypothetical protein